MNEKKKLTTEEALKYLGISRGTFFARIREHQIRPANFNAALKKQHKPEFAIEDLDKLKSVNRQK